MRKIKFRGVLDGTYATADRILAEGTTVYGYYYELKGDSYISEHRLPHETSDGRRTAEYLSGGLRVKPETVAQLIAIDRNGNEVYEGDAVKSPYTPDEMAFKATFFDYGALLDGVIVRCAEDAS